jgi:hypothetical protein
VFTVVRVSYSEKYSSALCVRLSDSVTDMNILSTDRLIFVNFDVVVLFPW